MLPLYTIATKPSALAESVLAQDVCDFRPAYQARPGMHVPMIWHEGGIEIVKGVWGYREPSASVIPMRRILTRAPFHLHIRSQRCVVPANAFFALKEQHPYLVSLLNERLMFLGAVYDVQAGLPHFALLQTSPADVFADWMKAMPVLIPKHNIEKWLTTNDLGTVMALADQGKRMWFDYFLVSDAVLDANKNERDLLRPMGKRFRDVLAEEQKNQAEAFKGLRGGRGKGG